MLGSFLRASRRSRLSLSAQKCSSKFIKSSLLLPRVASYASNATPTHKTTPVPVPRLPPIPPPVTVTADSPPKLIGQTELDTYLKPLYAKGWGIGFSLETVDFKGDRHMSSWPCLTKVFILKDVATAVEFTKEIAAIAKKEKHKISSLSTAANEVHLQTATLIPSPLIPHKLGITFADIRLAYLADASLAEEYAADRAEPPLLRSPRYRPGTYLEIEKRQWSTVVAQPEHIPSDITPRPLPSIPALTQHPGPLRDDEMAKYLRPLYTHGWSVNYLFLMRQHDEIVRRWRATRLLKRYDFKTYEGATIFMRTASEIASKEGDNIDISIRMDHRVFVGSSVKQKDGTRAITLNDVRVAILVETLFQEHFQTQARESFFQKTSSNQPLTGDEIEAGWLKYLNDRKARSQKKRSRVPKHKPVKVLAAA